MIFGATVGQPTTGACYVKASFALSPRNTSTESISSDNEMEFSHHISSHGTRYSSLYEINGVVCGFISAFCSANIDVLKLVRTEESSLSHIINKAIVDYTSPTLCTPVHDRLCGLSSTGDIGNMHKKLVKIVREIPELSSRTDTQTDILIRILCSCSCGRSNKFPTHQTKEWPATALLG